MKKKLFFVSVILLYLYGINAQVHTTYLWHMDQPIYWGEKSQSNPDACQFVKESDEIKNAGGNKYNDGSSHPLQPLFDIFSKADRVNAYQSIPRDAISNLSDLPNAGAQISFSGDLMQNIDGLGQGFQWGYTPAWAFYYQQARNWKTLGGVPKLDLVAFTKDHGFSPLISPRTLKKSIAAHRYLVGKYYGTTPGYSKGYWPAECAFSERIIKSLVEEGIEWVVVANSHLARTLNDYPLSYGTSGCNIDPPNKADKVTVNGGTVVGGHWWSGQIDGRGGTFAAPYCYTPHKAKYVDPETGVEYKITIVPMCDLLSYKDGYSAQGTTDIDANIAPYITDAAHPPLVLLAHDGDNAWGGGNDYYMNAVTNFSHAAKAKGYEPTTIQQYLNDHPVSATDVVHVEDGAWVNAEGDWGHPQFINWLWPLYNPTTFRFNPDAWTEDTRNWAVITAVENYVITAEDLSGGVRIDKTCEPDGTTTDAEKAWHFYYTALNSGYMYYGKSDDMEVKQTVGGNHAIEYAQNVLNSHSGQDNTAPSIFNPQRFPWNPGGKGFGPLFSYKEQAMPCDFDIWTYVFDVSGVQSVTLKYRTDKDGVNPLSDNDNDIYTGGSGVSAWNSVAMTKKVTPTGNVTNDPQINFFLLPTAIADIYYASITSLKDTLVDYYVEAVDAKGNVSRSAIQHVWVSDGQGSNTNPKVVVTPDNPTVNDVITITVTDADANTKLHWGVNDNGVSWTAPNSVYWPVGSVAAGTTAIQSSFSDPDSDNKFTVSIGTFNNAAQAVSKVAFVLKYGNGSWDNNGGSDYHITVSPVTNNNPTSNNFSKSISKNTTYTFVVTDFPFTGFTSATFAGIKLINVPTPGTLNYNSAAATANTDYADVTKFTFTPITGASGDPYTTFQFKVKDSQGRYSDANYTATLGVVSTNPNGSDITKTISMNTIYTFSSSDFIFSGYGGATFAGVKIVTLPDFGIFRYNGVNILADSVYANPALMTFTPVTGATGSPYVNFQFRVKDNMGRLSDANYTFTFNVTNTAPSGDNEKSVQKINTTRTFSNSDFHFFGVGSATFAGIRIMAVPTVGTLKYNGVAATVNTDYSTMSLFTYTPALGGVGYPYTNFKFKVKDNNGIYSNSTYTFVLNVIQAGVSWLPVNPSVSDTIIVTVGNATVSGKLHWGVNGVNHVWQTPNAAYRPVGSVLYNGTGPAVQTPLNLEDPGFYILKVGPFNNVAQAVTALNFVIAYDNGTWDNNTNADYNVTISSTNPTSANSSVTANINTTYTFATANFPFTSPVGATSAGIRVVALPSIGSLKYNGVAATANTDYATPSLLTYTPVTGATGSPYTTFTFLVKDNANRYSSTSCTMIINVIDPNPTSADSKVVTKVSTSLTFASTNFTFNGYNGATYAGIKLVTLPVAGSLKYNGANVVANTDYTDVTKLVFTPVAAATGFPYATFTFRVKDNAGNYSINSYTMKISVVAAGLSWLPLNPGKNEVILVSSTDRTLGAKLHWGVNAVNHTWTKTNTVYWPQGTVNFNGTDPAVQSPMVGPIANIDWLEIGPFNNSAQVVNTVDFVLNFTDGSWDNNGNNDYHIPISALKSAQTTVGVFKQELAVIIYPNPFNDMATIKLNHKRESDYKGFVIDAIGRNVIQFQFVGNEYDLHRMGIKNGLYILKIVDQVTNESFQSKIVVQ